MTLAVYGRNAPSQPNVTNAVSNYDCAVGAHAGYEAAWAFVPPTSGKWKIKLNKLTADCDLFLVSPTCDSTCLTPTAHSEVLGLAGEGLNESLTAGQMYFVVIDSQPGVTCDYELEVASQ